MKASNKKNMLLLIVVSTAAIFLFQTLWLYSSYKAHQTIIKRTMDAVLIDAIDSETIIRLEKCSSLKEEETIIDVSAEDIRRTESPIDILMQEFLVKASCFISLEDLHEICKRRLNKNDIQGTFIIQKINTNSNAVLESTHKNRHLSNVSIKTFTIPIRLEKPEGIRLLFIEPTWFIFKQMLFLLILSVLLMTFVIYVLYEQYHSFIKEKKLRGLQKDHTEAMIHTMKTPLQSIKQVHEFIDKGSFDHDIPKRKHFIKLATTQIKNLQRLVNRILSISQWEEGDLKLQKKPFDIKAMLFSLCQEAKETASKEVNIVPNLNIEEDTVSLDQEAIEDVVRNILENSIKYSYESVTIWVDAFTENDLLHLTIKDDGLGISEKAQKTIFNKFERGDAPFRKGAKGFGIGLAFVRGIVETHGGTISVKSKEGEGSEFYIKIPIKEINYEIQTFIHRR